MDTSPRGWLERLGMSLVIISLVLAWEGWRRASGRVAGEPGGYIAGAVVCGVLGFIGIALRHGRRD